MRPNGGVLSACFRFAKSRNTHIFLNRKHQRSAIILGASSGIGRALAIEMADQGWSVAIAGRREHLLAQLVDQVAGIERYRKIDVVDESSARPALWTLIREMGNVDVIVIASGVGGYNPRLAPNIDLDLVKTNVIGFVQMANEAMRYFESKRAGTLVGISSIAGERGSANGTSYCASKAFQSNYLEGLRMRGFKFGIDLIDVRPGFVATDMVKDDQVFWIAQPDVVARQIISAIVRGRPIVHVTKRWKLISLLLSVLPARKLATLK